MGAIIYWYIEVKVRKLCQEDPHLTMDFPYAEIAQYNIGWYNMVWVWIDLQWTKCKSNYLKEGKSRNTGLNS